MTEHDPTEIPAPAAPATVTRYEVAPIKLSVSRPAPPVSRCEFPDTGRPRPPRAVPALTR